MTPSCVGTEVGGSRGGESRGGESRGGGPHWQLRCNQRLNTRLPGILYGCLGTEAQGFWACPSLGSLDQQHLGQLPPPCTAHCGAQSRHCAHGAMGLDAPDSGGPAPAPGPPQSEKALHTDAAEPEGQWGSPRSPPQSTASIGRQSPRFTVQLPNRFLEYFVCVPWGLPLWCLAFWLGTLLPSVLVLLG